MSTDTKCFYAGGTFGWLPMAYRPTFEELLRARWADVKRIRRRIKKPTKGE